MFKSAPLPFIGQKRKVIKQYVELLHHCIDNDGEGWTIVDVFGGSGLLSHIAKQTKPAAHVIYNDFDGYAKRLSHIPDINCLRQRLAPILSDVPREKRLTPVIRQQIEQQIAEYDGFIDVQSLASWLLFSGTQICSLDELHSKNWYNSIRQSDYPLADGYLAGLEIRHLSFEKLLPDFIDNPKSLLILDPPYLCTAQGAYGLKNYFGMVQFLTLMRFVRPPFIFFSSTRSEFLDYLNFVITNKTDGYKQMEGYQLRQFEAQINYSARYQDNIVFKFSNS